MSAATRCCGNSPPSCATRRAGTALRRAFRPTTSYCCFRTRAARKRWTRAGAWPSARGASWATASRSRCTSACAVRRTRPMRATSTSSWTARASPRTSRASAASRHAPTASPCATPCCAEPIWSGRWKGRSRRASSSTSCSRSTTWRARACWAARRSCAGGVPTRASWDPTSSSRCSSRTGSSCGSTSSCSRACAATCAPAWTPGCPWCPSR